MIYSILKKNYVKSANHHLNKFLSASDGILLVLWQFSQKALPADLNVLLIWSLWKAVSKYS